MKDEEFKDIEHKTEFNYTITEQKQLKDITCGDWIEAIK